VLRACEDALAATERMPEWATAWRRAAESLAELRKLAPAVQCYEEAIALEPELADELGETVDKLRLRLMFADKGLPDDLALEVVER